MNAAVLPPVAVVGGGLAGSLAALALAHRGFAVSLLAPPAAAEEREPSELGTATALSYGALAGPASWQAWRDLETVHGPLGLRAATLLRHGDPWLDRLPPGLQAWPSRLLGFGRVDPAALLGALPAALAAAGVQRQSAVVRALEPRHPGWRLCLDAATGPATLETARVVLAAGAGSRALWPDLPEQLRVSWAGVLTLPRVPPGPWPAHAGRGRVVQPFHWQRPLLEGRALSLQSEDWIVDAGLAPRDEGLVVGQVTVVRPGTASGPPPDPATMEERLRDGLRRLDPALGALAGTYRQVPVAFCVGGEPLVGPIAGAAGLWAFTGFSAAFSRVPIRAVDLAAWMAAEAEAG
ncbi:FAD-dependent oxidoreductase [Cyanobium sp. FGCU-52]|nr:FAD-dependent oxidoreductase [Cyanobium sp. FGCU52]